MRFVKELEVVLRFVEDLDEHRQRSIASFAAHMVLRSEEDATMTEDEIKALRILEYDARARKYGGQTHAEIMAEVKKRIDGE